MNRTLILAFAASSLAAVAIFGSVNMANASAPNTYVKLQGSSPGAQQPGNTNISGKGIFGASGLGYNGGAAVFTFSDLAGFRGEGVGGVNAGLLGISDTYVGVVGYTSAGIAAVFGRHDGANGIGLYGFSTGTNSTGLVASGASYGVQASGVTGVSGTGSSYGVVGVPGSASAFGVYATNGYFSGDFWNSTTSDGTGVVGQADTGSSAKGVWGYSGSGYGGYFYGASNGIYSSGGSSGVVGSGTTHGGLFSSTGSDTYATESYSDVGTFAIGVYGHSATGYGGTFSGRMGVSAYGSGNGNGVYTTAGGASAVWASSSGGSISTDAGVYGRSTQAGGNGIIGEVTGGGAAYAIWGKATAGTYAGFFSGNVHVAGTLSKTAGAFKIDHPQDPENKYLWHSFVESPDMMNIYNGNVVTDASGYADVALPSYFEALNKEFRYQLTVLDNSDDFVMAKVTREVEGNSFTLRTSKPNVKVSWQVTGIRHDPYAEAHRIPNEVDKPEAERGFYIHPELYDKAANKAVEYSPLKNNGVVSVSPEGQKLASTRTNAAAATAARIAPNQGRPAPATTAATSALRGPKGSSTSPKGTR